MSNRKYLLLLKTVKTVEMEDSEVQYASVVFKSKRPPRGEICVYIFKSPLSNMMLFVLEVMYVLSVMSV